MNKYACYNRSEKGRARTKRYQDSLRGHTTKLARQRRSRGTANPRASQKQIELWLKEVSPT